MKDSEIVQAVSLVTVARSLALGLFKVMAGWLANSKACQTCGRSDLSVQEASLIHKVLSDNHFLLLKAAAETEAGAEAAKKPATLDLKDLPFDNPELLPPIVP